MRTHERARIPSSLKGLGRRPGPSFRTTVLTSYSERSSQLDVDALSRQQDTTRGDLMKSEKKWSAFDVDGDHADEPIEQVEDDPTEDAIEWPNPKPKKTPNHRTALDHYELRSLDLSDPRSLIPIVEALGEIRSAIGAARFAKSDASDKARSEKRKANKCKAYRAASKELDDLESAESVVGLFLDVAKKIAGL